MYLVHHSSVICFQESVLGYLSSVSSGCGCSGGGALNYQVRHFLIARIGYFVGWTFLPVVWLLMIGCSDIIHTLGLMNLLMYLMST